MAPQHRMCDQCRMHMPPGTPRRTLEDGSKVCENCAKEPSRSRVSASLFSRALDVLGFARDADPATLRFTHESEEQAALHTADIPAYDTLYSRTHPRAPLKDQTPVVDYAHALHNYLHQFNVTHDCNAATAALHVAHDSGDGSTIFHCPFCGSGQVVGGQDGTVTCDFCGNHFTVQVQPEFAAMPQTVDGTPYPMPGMPGSTTDTAPGAAADDDVEDAQANAAGQGAPVPPDPNDPTQKPPQQVATGSLVLPFDDAVAHFALKHSGANRPLVLGQVRARHESKT